MQFEHFSVLSRFCFKILLIRHVLHISFYTAFALLANDIVSKSIMTSQKTTFMSDFRAQFSKKKNTYLYEILIVCSSVMFYKESEMNFQFIESFVNLVCFMFPRQDSEIYKHTCFVNHRMK